MGKNNEVTATTKQVAENHKENGDFATGNNANPEGKGGFGERPENRSDGRWSKDTSVSYWYNYLGRLSDEEFAAFKPSSKFQRMAYRRLQEADEDNVVTKGAALDVTKEITDRTEGKAKQDIGLSADESIMPLIKGFVIPTLPKDFIKDDGSSSNDTGEQHA